MSPLTILYEKRTNIARTVKASITKVNIAKILPLYTWLQNCNCNEIKLSAQHSVQHRKPDYFAVEEISNWKIHLFIWFKIRFDEKNENFWKNAKQNCHTSGFYISNVKWNCISVNSILRKLKIEWPLMLVAYPG